MTNISLNIAVLTISDTRTPDNDTSGDLLAKSALESRHHLVDRSIIKDDVYQIRATVSAWIANSSVQVIICTGGTGISACDITP